MGKSRPNGQIQVCSDVDRLGSPHTFLPTFYSLHNMLLYILFLLYSVCLHPASGAYFAFPSLRWVVLVVSSYILLCSIYNKLHCERNERGK